MLSCASLRFIYSWKTVIRFMQPWFLPAKLSWITRWPWPDTRFSGSGQPEAAAHCSLGNSELWGRADDHTASQCAGNLILRNTNRTACYIISKLHRASTIEQRLKFCVHKETDVSVGKSVKRLTKVFMRNSNQMWRSGFKIRKSL